MHSCEYTVLPIPSGQLQSNISAGVRQAHVQAWMRNKRSAGCRLNLHVSMFACTMYYYSR